MPQFRGGPRREEVRESARAIPELQVSAALQTLGIPSPAGWRWTESPRLQGSAASASLRVLKSPGSQRRRDLAPRRLAARPEIRSEAEAVGPRRVLKLEKKAEVEETEEPGREEDEKMPTRAAADSLEKPWAAQAGRLRAALAGFRREAAGREVRGLVRLAPAWKPQGVAGPVRLVVEPGEPEPGAVERAGPSATVARGWDRPTARVARVKGCRACRASAEAGCAP
jgi:hypothetical protein